jgi:hypothetical protein
MRCLAFLGFGGLTTYVEGEIANWPSVWELFAVRDDKIF